MVDRSAFQDLPEDMTALSSMCEALFDVIEDGVCLLSFDARIIGANRIFFEMIGLPHAQLIGRSFNQAFSQVAELSPLANFLSHLRLSEQVVSELVAGSYADQQLRVRLAPIRNGQGRICVHMVVIREIDDIAAREREIARVEQRARFGELAAGLAHEIKNPLAGIQGVVDILIGRRAPDDGEREVLEGVRREVRRIDSTVQTLLDRARPRKINRQPTSILDTVERAVSLAQASLKTAHKDQICFDIEPAIDPIVMPIDAVQIEDGVLNLLLNAIDAIDDIGSIKVRVYETLPDKEAGEVVIEVTDTGRGIAPEDLTRIFSPFYTTNPTGTGLGLSAVRGIARAHGGRIEVSSELHQGSTFSLRLPRKSSRVRLPSTS